MSHVTSTNFNERSRFLPGFIPGSLYVVVMEHITPFTKRPDVGADSPLCLGLFYLEKPTLPPFSLHCVLQGHYWGLFSPKHGDMTPLPARHRPVKLSIPIQEALGGPQGEISMEDVLGYVRIAESVDLPALNTHICLHDDRIDPNMTSGTYVYNAFHRLRMSGVLRSCFWAREDFNKEIGYFRGMWAVEKVARLVTKRKFLENLQKNGIPFSPDDFDIEAGQKKEFAEVWWCEFSSQEHYRSKTGY